jgi:lactate dehydrogenase-like 2-hydroxyacid dehydrogenase
MFTARHPRRTCIPIRRRQSANEQSHQSAETARHFKKRYDAITRAVIEKSLPRLKIISKYGIGLGKIDLPAAKELNIPVLFTPGVNHTTVAEHTFGLLIGNGVAIGKQAATAKQAAKRGWNGKVTIS